MLGGAAVSCSLYFEVIPTPKLHSTQASAGLAARQQRELRHCFAVQVLREVHGHQAAGRSEGALAMTGGSISRAATYEAGTGCRAAGQALPG
jgi:hypothetical protein